jgi:hypothetical protein
MNIARQFDRPHDVIVHLANNEAHKRQIPGLIARAKVAKLEKQLADLRASKETAA